jgi:hypothetical protein
MIKTARKVTEAAGLHIIHLSLFIFSATKNYYNLAHQKNTVVVPRGKKALVGCWLYGRAKKMVSSVSNLNCQEGIFSEDLLCSKTMTFSEPLITAPSFW